MDFRPDRRYDYSPRPTRPDSRYSQPAPQPTFEPAASVKNHKKIALPKGRPSIGFFRKNFVFVALVILLVAAVCAAAIYYRRAKNAEAELAKNNIVTAQQQQSNVDKIQEIVSKVGKLTDLPKGETPALAEIMDISKLKTQPFFSKAQNGDDVLIYSKAKIAYIYRPSSNRIINIAPVTTDGNVQGSSSNTNSTSTTNTSLPGTSTTNPTTTKTPAASTPPTSP